jgi:hypothetical protein
MKLYSVKTTVNEFDGCRDVQFHWFRCDRGEPRPYAELIEDYDPRAEFAGYSEGTIDELFAANGANALKEYLDQRHGDTANTTIEKSNLPLSS